METRLKGELRRHLNDPNPPTATSSSNDHNNSTDPRPDNGRQVRMLNRMSDLVNRIRSRSQSSTSSGSKTKKRKMDRVKEHRIQVRWSHWNKAKCEFMPVKQKNGGGNRLEEMRRQRVACLSLSGNLEEENSGSTAEATGLADTTQVHNENRNQGQPENGESTCMESTD